MAIYISQPWEPTSSRKGDPLGFQDVADLIADEIAPGLSGRNRDARWLTLLCKGLTGFTANILNEEDPYLRIALWERAIIVHAMQDSPQNKTRQLPGKTKAHAEWPDKYRYYGPYGSYKKLMIRIGLLDKDGYRLTTKGKDLAKVIGDDLKVNLNTTIKDMTKVCTSSTGKISKWLPTIENTKLPQGEIQILSDLLFGDDDDGKTRKQTFKWMKGRDFWMNKKNGIPGSFCVAFDDFTSSCFNALQEIATKLDRSTEIESPDCWDEVMIDAKKVHDVSDNLNINDSVREVVALAEQLQDGVSQTLVEHHINLSMNGKKWIGKQDGKYFSLVGENESIRKGYNFRLYNIWRLGNQLIPGVGPNKFPWEGDNSADGSEE